MLTIDIMLWIAALATIVSIVAGVAQILSFKKEKAKTASQTQGAVSTVSKH